MLIKVDANYDCKPYKIKLKKRLHLNKPAKLDRYRSAYFCLTA